MIDLHTHSTASDGDFTPTELLNLAAKKGLTALALTDHDTVDGLEEAANRARELAIRFIPGVEIETQFKPGEFHLLGLDIRHHREGFASFLDELQIRRKARNQAIIEKMRAQGLDVSLEGMEERTGGEILGRLHFATWLIETGQAKNVPDAFSRWLGPGKPFHEPKARPTLEDAIAAIHEAGGKAVLAHPLSLWISWGRLNDRLAEWADLGLDGIEARHSGASEREARRFEELAEKFGLITTGGSDFHGEGRPDRKLGKGAGGKRIPEDWMKPFLDSGE